MDITDPVLDRLDQDAVDQLDDRRIGGGKLFRPPAAILLNGHLLGSLGGQRPEIVNIGDIFFFLGFLFRAGELQKLLFADLIIFLIRLQDILFGGDADGQNHFHFRLEFFHGARIRRLGHGDLQCLAGNTQRQGAILFDHIKRHGFENFRVGRFFLEIDGREIMDAAQHIEDGRVFNITEFDEDAAQPLAGFFLNGEGLLQLGVENMPLFSENLADLGFACSGLVLDRGPQTSFLVYCCFLCRKRHIL